MPQHSVFGFAQGYQFGVSIERQLCYTGRLEADVDERARSKWQRKACLAEIAPDLRVASKQKG